MVAAYVEPEVTGAGMDLIDLDLVIAIADRGSITQGATQAHLSLPSASARLRALEQVLDARLFDRHRRGATPTPAGKLLVRHARSIHRDVDRMRTALAEHAQGSGVTVRAWANTAATTSLLTPAASSYLAAQPDTRLLLERHPSAEVVAAVADLRTELGIVSDSVDLGGLDIRTLRPDPLVLATARDDPLARRDRVSFTEVNHREFVVLATSSPFPLDVRPVVRTRLPTLDGVCDVLAQGMGIGILPLHSITPWVASGRLAAVGLDDHWAQRNLVVCFSAGEDLSPAAGALLEHLIAAAAKGF